VVSGGVRSLDIGSQLRGAPNGMGRRTGRAARAGSLGRLPGRGLNPFYLRWAQAKTSAMRTKERVLQHLIG
jgi:hypothetical protein